MPVQILMYPAPCRVWKYPALCRILTVARVYVGVNELKSANHHEQPCRLQQSIKWHVERFASPKSFQQDKFTEERSSLVGRVTLWDPLWRSSNANLSVFRCIMFSSRITCTTPQTAARLRRLVPFYVIKRSKGCSIGWLLFGAKCSAMVDRPLVMEEIEQKVGESWNSRSGHAGLRL